jgi:hypothetical protein
VLKESQLAELYTMLRARDVFENNCGENCVENLIMAATDATEEELARVKDGKFPDRTTPIQMEKRVWRAQVRSEYVEPEQEIDENDQLDYIFKNAGKTALKTKVDLPPRDDVILWNEAKHGEELKDNFQKRDCPEEHLPVVQYLIQQYWDIFCREGALRPICGFQFRIDARNHPPTTCKVPRYGPHESMIMKKLLGKLFNAEVIEIDEGPYGAMVVLAQKPNQEHKHHSEYIFHLCVSYRLLNAITRPFLFPLPRCDDAVQEIDPREYAFDAGYWQVLIEKNSREKTGFYTPTGKAHWRNMPMGIKNAAAYFVCVVLNMKTEWDEHWEKEENGVRLIQAFLDKYGELSPSMLLQNSDARELYKTGKPGSSVIVDDLIVYAMNPPVLLAYFEAILTVLLHYRVAIRLRKCHFLPEKAEFVGIDVCRDGNSPASSKYTAIRNLKPPKLFSDLRMFIGLLGFYAQRLPYYEERIAQWREYIKQKPPPNTSKEEEHAKLTALWNPKTPRCSTASSRK